MYAVIESGGKQYRVELGSEIEVDRMDAEPGRTIDLERVLLVVDGDGPAIGTPTVDGAVVRADVVRQDRGDKIVVFKYKPKARSRVKKGHRRDLTVLRIADIAFGGRSAAEEAKTVQEAADRERTKQEKDAAARAKRDEELAARLAEAQAAVEAELEAKAPPPKSRKRRSPAAPTAVDAAAPTAVDAAAVDTAGEPSEASATPSETAATAEGPIALSDSSGSAEASDVDQPEPPERAVQDQTTTKDE